MREEVQAHSRLLKCALQVEETRAYWERRRGGPPTPVKAFEGYWFGAKSLARVEVLLANLRHRYEAFPPSLEALGRWRGMSAQTRRVICHWHLQLADPLYRHFTSSYLDERRKSLRQEVTRALVAEWVEAHGPMGWTRGTRIQFASKLLSSAFAAGLVGSARDPRRLTLPRVEDEALEYLLYLLREVEFDGTLLDNPYLRSVGIDGADLERRLAPSPAVRLERQNSLVDFRWSYPDLSAWAAGRVAAPLAKLLEALP